MKRSSQKKIQTQQIPHSLRRIFRSKFTTEERYVSKQDRKRLLLGSFILGGVGVIVFVALVVQVMNNFGITSFDNALQTWFVSIRSATITSFSIAMAVVFGPVFLPLMIVVVTTVWIIFAKHAWRPLLLAGAMAAGVTLIQIITRLVQHQRPPIDLMLFGKDTTYSFPSGHVSGTTIFFFVLSYLIISRNPTKKRIIIAGIISFIVVASQVFSRLYLGYHWFSDTMASIALAVVILSAVMIIDTHRTVRIPGEKVTGKYSKKQTENT